MCFFPPVAHLCNVLLQTLFLFLPVSFFNLGFVLFYCECVGVSCGGFYGDFFQVFFLESVNQEYLSHPPLWAYPRQMNKDLLYAAFSTTQGTVNIALSNQFISEREAAPVRGAQCLISEGASGELAKLQTPSFIACPITWKLLVFYAPH